MLASDVWWSKGASSFGGVELSTSGSPSVDPNSWYIYKGWVFGLSNKKQGFISHEFRLGNSACSAVRNERPHSLPRGYMTFSKAILKTWVFLSLHPFIVLSLHPFIAQVLDYFDIVPFQLPSNSHLLIVTFYFVFSKYYGVAPSVVHFAYIYGLKALAKHVGFWYLTYRGDSMGIAGLPSNSGP